MYRLLFTMLAIALISDVHAVVLKQPERADQNRKQAVNVPFVPVGTIGGGVAIAPDWILTAGHVAQGLVPGVSALRIGGTDYEVRRVAMPDSFVLEPEQRRLDDDLALLQLDRPLTDVLLAETACQPPFAGEQVTFIGSGDHEDAEGRALDSVPVSAVLAGPNIVHAVTPQWIEIALDAPTSPSDAVMSAGGDSGGPLLRRDDDRWQVIGVSSHYAFDGATDYRRDRFTRVDRHCDFIRTTIEEGPTTDSASTPVPEAVRSVVLDWTAAYNAGVDEMLAFYDGPSSAIETTGESATRYRTLFDAWGTIELLGVAPGPEPDSVLVGARSEKVGRFEFVVLLASGDPPTMRGLATFDSD